MMSRERISRDTMFFKICEIVAQRSTCLRAQVGAIIVRDGRVISMGYNGPISGMPACEEKPAIPDPPEDESKHRNWALGVFDFLGDYPKTHPLVCQGAGCDRSIHAETNAIAFAARFGVSVEGCTMYCTDSPCINCAKMIVNSGIKCLKYMRPYRDTSGIDLLRQSGIEVIEFEISKEE